MSQRIPAGYTLPPTVVTLEQQIIHSILVASRIYSGEQILEEKGKLAPVCEYYFFRSGSGELRIGFRGSWEVDEGWVLGTVENQDFWEYVKEHAVVSLPVGFFAEI